VTALLLVHLVVGVGILAVGRRIGGRAAPLAALAPLAGLVWLATRWDRLTGGAAPLTEHVSWIPQLGLGFDLRIDGFAALLVALITGIGTLVLLYAGAYLPVDGPRTGRLIGLLVLFGGAMLGLVSADNLLVLYGFWELTSVTSFLLIGNDHDKPEARAAAVQAFLITGAGGLSLLGGILLLGNAAGTFDLHRILQEPPSGATVSVALALMLVGAFTKSAQVPFHSWLPGAMVAPTPVSAYLHSATMVKAGVYLVARLSPAFAPTVAWWRPVVIGVGLTTMVVGGVRALRQHDLKLLLAHGTVSQLGFLVAVFGIGTPAASVAGAALLLAHAVFKAANFLAVGAVDVGFGTRDRRRLPRLDRSWAPVGIGAVVGAASMAGIPLTFGFVAKELDFEAMFAGDGAAWLLASVVLVGGAALTAGYSLRFAVGILGRNGTDPLEVEPATARVGVGLVGPLLVLTAVTAGLGVLPYLGDRLLAAAAGALAGPLAAADVHLAIWHGLNAALGASAVALALGLLLHLGRERLAPALERLGARLPDGNEGYRAILRGLNDLADRVTSRTQPGSLPIYAGVILVTAALLPLVAFLPEGRWPGWPRLVETPAHVPVAAALVGAGLAASVVRRRFSAALFLGVAGYAMAALFVVQGAPDLALTQASIETLSTVLFVLVLRRLPDRFTWGSGSSAMTTRTRTLRVLASLCVFAVVFVLAIVTASPDPTTPASEQMVARSLPDGHGRNVVNVTLVDFRGYDTLGEITVLACAAIGTVALARSGRRPARAADAQRTGLRRSRDLFQRSPAHVRAARADDLATAGPSAATPAGGAAPNPSGAQPLGRLVVLDVSVRVVFTAVMIGSIYLLFAGHNQPGGGFAGGILAGAAVALRYLAGGIESVRSLSRARPWTVLGAGVGLAAATALTPVLFGHPVLTSAYRSVDVPLVGSVSLTSVLLFDLGVYLAVVALSMMMFESFGDDPFSDREEEPVHPPTPAATDAAGPGAAGSADVAGPAPAETGTAGTIGPAEVVAP